jgi:hypothetical protein
VKKDDLINNNKVNFNPEFQDFYVALSNVTQQRADFVIDDGILMEPTEMKVKPQVMYPLPSHWKDGTIPVWQTIRFGNSYEIGSQIVFKQHAKAPIGYDRLNAAGLIVSCIRFMLSTNIEAPLIGNKGFNLHDIKQDESNDVVILPLETVRHKIRDCDPKEVFLVSDSCIDWISKHWRTVAKIGSSNESFDRAFFVYDDSARQGSCGLATLQILSSIERLFVSGGSDLSYRLSLRVASYLEVDSEERFKCFKSVQRLYKERSKIAHGGTSDNLAAYLDSRRLLQRILRNIIESGIVPSDEDLDKLVTRR